MQVIATFQFSPEIRDLILESAKKRGTTQSGYIRDAVLAYEGIENTSRMTQKQKKQWIEQYAKAKGTPIGTPVKSFVLDYIKCCTPTNVKLTDDTPKVEELSKFLNQLYKDGKLKRKTEHYPNGPAPNWFYTYEYNTGSEKPDHDQEGK